MTDDGKQIRQLEVHKGEAGDIRLLRVVFGPHYFIELATGEDGDGVDLALGYTHHGFRADGSTVNGQLERIINEVRERHSDLVID